MIANIDENILLTTARFKNQGDYWIGKLSGIWDKEETHLLFTNRRHTGAGKDKRQIDFSLPRQLVRQMVKLSKESDLSIYILLLAGLKTLIYRYTGNQDIITVSPVYKYDVTDETINDVLLIRDALYEEMSFKELVLTVRQTLLAAYDNQDYPFDRLAEACLNPFMTTVACVFENIHEYNERLTARLKDQVIFLFRLDESRLSCRIIFDPGRYQPYYIEKILGHFTRILEQAVEDLNTKISRIFYLSEHEKKRLLYDYSNREYRYPVEPAYFELFEGQVEKTPDKVALVYEDSYLTYRELNESSLRLAYVLRERGVSGGSIAALKVDPGFFMITGIMGILKAGGAFLPIGADYPEERIDYMLRDSNTALLLTSEELSDVMGKGTRYCAPTTCNLHLSLVYVIYTSGSTGRPKGVLITHGNLTPMLLWSRDYFGLGEHTRVLQNLSYTFDFGVFELLTTLVFGGTLYFFDRSAITDAREYTTFIDSRRINTLHTTPSFLSSILTAGEQMSSLRILHLGGERLSGTLIDTAARQLSPGCCIYNGYGPTETTINSTIFKVVPGMDMSYRDSTKTADNTPIGKPSANNTVYILDSRGRLVPIGAAGELYIGGGGVAPGYLNRPELTAEKFDQDLWDYQDCHDEKKKNNEKFLRGSRGRFFQKEPPGRRRLYKTGDLCCWLPDGNIEFLGRIDHQVKIRGFRVELGEIESRLLEYPGIKEALVIALDHFLCAYIVRGDTDSSFFARLKEYLSQKLPDYMVPSYLLELDKIPLTPSGKADRSALPEPGTGISGEDYAAPLGSLEEELVSIWGELLGIEKDLISVNADFFQLGGHSLLAMGLISKLHQRLDVKIPLGQVLQTPTIRELAAVIKGAAKDKHLSLEKAEEREYYVLSSAQRRLYYLQQLVPESTPYNMPYIEILDKETGSHRDKLEQAFRKLIRRHESLRTSFHMVEGMPVQRVHDPEEVEFEIGIVQDQKLPTANVLCQLPTDFIRPFDLSQAPLLRAALIKEKEDRYLLMVDMHHIISDGISTLVLLSDFTALYNGEELAALRFQYKDYAIWQQLEKESAALQVQQDYWVRQFKQDIPVLNLPTDYPRPEVQQFEGDSVSFDLGNEETAILNQLVSREGATLYMVLAALYTLLLSKISGQEDIVVGTPVAGRGHADLEKIIGMFVNTLPIRNRVLPDQTFNEFLKHVKERALSAFENQDCQFEDIVDRVIEKRDASRNPLFDAMFALHGADIQVSTSLSREVKPFIFNNQEAKFDLTLTAIEAGKEENLSFTLNYNSRLFKPETVERFVNYFKEITAVVVENPMIRLEDIKISHDLFNEDLQVPRMEIEF